MILKQLRTARTYTDDESLPEAGRLLWLKSESYAGWLLIDLAYTVDEGWAFVDLKRSELIDGCVFLEGVPVPRNLSFLRQLFDLWKRRANNRAFARWVVQSDWERCRELMRRRRA
jgi:hypothetical protein